MVHAHARRQAKAADARAWMVAHLMLASGNLRKGTRVDGLMRDLLGRAPGTVPGQTTEPRATPTLTPDQSVDFMAAFVRAAGGQDLRVDPLKPVED